MRRRAFASFRSSRSFPWLLACGCAFVAASAAACSSSSSTNSGGTDAGGSDVTSSSSSGSSSGGSSGGGSGSGSGSSSGGGSGSSSGSSSGGLDAGAGGLPCPTTPCPGGQVCCANVMTDLPECMTSCPAGDSLGCLGPSDCTSATPDCCATDVLVGYNDAGTAFPHCQSGSLTTQCVAQCTSNIQVSCTATETLHVCKQASDCAGDTANPRCCLVNNYHVCVSTLLSTLGQLSCL